MAEKKKWNVKEKFLVILNVAIFRKNLCKTFIYLRTMKINEQKYYIVSYVSKIKICKNSKTVK